ncbi:uncharacterized protein LOC111677853 [Lucilia cuprina]|uniref:uncharacterized protein LOC111677853 n=1 Tax=Lucilia cuprina TaxID=7375 RepID=UPI001F0580DA|nr:uncharacterized protein LOC111677853 [Lucilia cuprina]XP_046810193.1 uncharacterized protein LOC111677853 [Lucilia cuprina]
MKKVARMRLSPNNMSEEVSNNHNTGAQSQSSNNEPLVRTTGRIKKPKAVFDPSDNYLPRAQRSLNAMAAGALHHNTNSSLERRASYTKASTISPVADYIEAKAKDACTVCKKKESKRPVFANKNPLITCQECQRKIHKQCLKVDFEDFESIQRNYKCDLCSNCRICNDKFTNPEEEMITCSKCTKSFHLVCFPSKIIKTDNQRNWKCNKCQVYNHITNGTTLPVKKIREIIGGGEPMVQTTPVKSANAENEKTPAAESANNDAKQSATSPSSQKRLNDSKEVAEAVESSPPPEKRAKVTTQSPDTISVETTSLNMPLKTDSTVLCYTPNENFDDIPDVKEWSVDQVYEYFFKHFPNEAHVFKDEEIDGRSLLLLKRSDVVKKLPIKLGPSLRIYSLILKIQAQLNDPTLGWNCGL